MKRPGELMRLLASSVGLVGVGLLVSCSTPVSEHIANVEAANEGAGVYVGGSYFVPVDVPLSRQLVGEINELTDGRIVGLEVDESREYPVALVVRESITATENLVSYNGEEISGETWIYATPVIVGGRWMIIETLGHLWWWDFEREPDTIHRFDFPEQYSIRNYETIAPLNDHLFYFTFEHSGEVSEFVLDLEANEVRARHDSDFDYLKTLGDVDVVWNYANTGWSVARGPEDAFLYNADFSIVIPIPPEISTKYRDVLYRFPLPPEGVVRWLEETDDDQVTMFSYSADGYETVTYDSSDPVIQSLEDQAYRRARISASRMAYVLDGELVIWDAEAGLIGSAPIPTDGDTAVPIEDRDTSYRVEIVTILDDGRLLTIFNTGQVITWDLSGDDPVPTVQFTTTRTDTSTRLLVVRRDPFYITQDGHVVIQWARTEGQSRVSNELQIIKLAD